MARDDPFDSLFDLEDSYYDEGYSQGFSDGVAQSSLEAKVFGVEKGFEKFVEMGVLAARARIWSTRLSCAPTDAVRAGSTRAVESISARVDELQLSDGTAAVKATSKQVDLPPLPSRSRLSKHVERLEELVQPKSLSLLNDDNAVGDFDERLRHAQAKVKIIEKLISEDRAGVRDAGAVEEVGRKARGRLEGNMEDFGG